MRTTLLVGALALLSGGRSGAPAQAPKPKGVRFEYQFIPKADALPGIPDGKYPPGLWRGSAISNTVEVQLKPNG